MDKRLTFWGIAGFAVLYFVAVFAAEFIGFIHPVCWVLAPALGALLGAVPYRWLSVRWHKFGLGTLLAAVFGLLMLAMGEVDITRLLIIVGCGLISDVVRLCTNKDCVTYPILALGNLAGIIYMWTRKAWYLQGAAEEVGQSYADAMAQLQNTLWFVIAVVAIVAAAEVGLWIARKLVK
ncbi:MAG: MptD family putative ECF transporter S component [Bacteroidales bacterium]|nr:MptD family putative ECF transporter S component [Bacteroidales bacterium]